MNVLIISTAENSGGGAIAARRLLIALEEKGINVKMIVRDKQTNHPSVIALKKGKWDMWRFVWERFVIWSNNLFSRKNLFKVSIANTGYDITNTKEFQDANIIHLHWVNQGMLSLDCLRKIILSGKRIVWTMHDMWQCTAICHHAYSCERFKSECQECPFLRFPSKSDLAHKVFKKKKDLFENSGINIVTVSKWLEKQAKASTLLHNCPTQVIPNTLSLSDFVILDKAECRKAFGIPQEKNVIIFGAVRIDDPIKGFPMLIQAIQHLIDNGGYTAQQLHLITFGIFKDEKPVLPIAHTDMGWIGSNAILPQLYSAADVAVSASHYETFGQTLIEALACGCIPVSFGNSGQTDIIEHKQNGYLADYLATDSLAHGIDWALTDGKNIDKEKLREEVINKYSGNVVAEEYIKLYNKLLNTQL